MTSFASAKFSPVPVRFRNIPFLQIHCKIPIFEYTVRNFYVLQMSYFAGVCVGDKDSNLGVLISNIFPVLKAICAVRICISLTYNYLRMDYHMLTI
jgi:hypothetical protein